MSTSSSRRRSTFKRRKRELAYLRKAWRLARKVSCVAEGRLRCDRERFHAHLLDVKSFSETVWAYNLAKDNEEFYYWQIRFCQGLERDHKYGDGT